jgi:hypothetical protein
MPIPEQNIRRWKNCLHSRSGRGTAVGSLHPPSRRRVSEHCIRCGLELVLAQCDSHRYECEQHPIFFECHRQRCGENTERLQSVHHASGWEGPLASFDNAHSYQIFLAQPATLRILGQPLADEFTVPIASGWNWVGYPRLGINPVGPMLDSYAATKAT